MKNFDHTKESMAEACGINLDELNTKIGTLIDAHNEAEAPTSMLVEKMETEFSTRELALMAVNGLVENKSPFQLFMEAMMSNNDKEN